MQYQIEFLDATDDTVTGMTFIDAENDVDALVEATKLITEINRIIALRRDGEIVGRIRRYRVLGHLPTVH